MTSGSPGEVHHLVVVGASLAGLRAVEAARKAGHEGPITLVGAEAHLPYDRPPLSKDFLAAADPPDAPTYRSEAVLVDDLGVRLLLGEPATGLDTDARVVAVGDREVHYDALVVATGSHARRLPGPGADLGGIHLLRTLDDALALRAAVEAGVRDVVVVGAGFIGSEVASSLSARGASVTVVEALPTPLVRAVGAEMGPAIASLHERHGTRLLCGVGVRALEGADGRVERVVLTDDTVLPADLVVVGVGVSPAVEWLAGSGVRVDEDRGGLWCDETLWTGVPGVHAAGDVVSWPNAATGVRQRMENWTAAADQGATAARHALDPAGATPCATVPFAWSDWYGVKIQVVGDPHADEVVLVEGDPADPGSTRWVALYRRGDRLVGALTVQGQGEVMKYRRLIAGGTSWPDALDHAARRRALAAEKAAARG